MTTCAMARPRSLPPWKFWKAKVIGTPVLSTPSRRRFLKFLRCLDDEFADQEIELHLVIDNYGTHKHPKVKALAPSPSALRAAFHSDQFQLAQPSGAVVWPIDPESGAPGSFSTWRSSPKPLGSSWTRGMRPRCRLHPDRDGGRNHGENKYVYETSWIKSNQDGRCAKKTEKSENPRKICIGHFSGTLH